MSDTLEDYLGPDDDFDLMLERAEERAWNSRQQQFVADLWERYEEHGLDMFISQSQWDWLMSIIR